MTNRKKINTIVIASLSVISAAGIFYYIYYKTKIKRLNAQVKTVDELRKQIEALDIPEGENEYTPVDPDSQSNMEFDENGNPIDPEGNRVSASTTAYSEATYTGYASY